jgi:hypothetical protein
VRTRAKEFGDDEKNAIVNQSSNTIFGLHVSTVCKKIWHTELTPKSSGDVQKSSPQSSPGCNSLPKNNKITLPIGHQSTQLKESIL